MHPSIPEEHIWCRWLLVSCIRKVLNSTITGRGFFPAYFRLCLQFRIHFKIVSRWKYCGFHAIALGAIGQILHRYCSEVGVERAIAIVLLCRTVPERSQQRRQFNASWIPRWCPLPRCKYRTKSILFSKGFPVQFSRPPPNWGPRKSPTMVRFGSLRNCGPALW